jgi:hypothetical protein
MRTGGWRVVVLSTAIALLASSFAGGCGGGKKDSNDPGDVAADEGDDSEDQGSDEMVDPEKLDELNACFVRKRPSVARCYSEAVESGKLDKKAKGRITVEMLVTADGHPKNVRIAQDTLRSPEVVECIKTTIGAWEIPGPGMDTEFSFSYDFEPE